MKRLSLILAYIGLAVISPSYAEATEPSSPTPMAKWYQIEMIIFSQITKETLGSEQWPLLSGALKIPANAQIPSLLPHSQFHLQDAENALRQNSQYQVLMHIAWNQPFTVRGKKIPLRIQSVNDSGDSVQINGLLTIALTHYIDMHFNFMIAEPKEYLEKINSDMEWPSTENSFFYFHMMQTRRTKSGELNYIDFPLFGVLIEAFPLDQKTED
ncbi:MAG TPA: CsiV family protein [Coxiellaceae bacterium]|nr:CsiV family protein [Coxiellaceae bacterium]